MPNGSLADSSFKEDIQTGINNTQKKILRYIKDFQPVCRKVVKMNTESFAPSTIDNNINMLVERDILETNENGGLIVVNEEVLN